MVKNIRFSFLVMLLCLRFCISDVSVVGYAKTTKQNAASETKKQTKTYSYKKSSLCIKKSQTIQQSKKTMELDVKVASGAGIYEYCFALVKDGERQDLQSWSNDSVYAWSAKEAGTYKIYAAIRKRNQPQRLLQSRSFTFQVDAPLTIEKVTLKKKKNQVQIATTASGGTENYSYTYWIEKNGKKIWKEKKSDTQNSVNWNCKQAGTYHVYVKVQDDAGNICTHKKIVSIQ